MAARAAGLLTVVVPNEIIRGLSFSEAYLTLESLEDIDLPGLRAARREASAGHPAI